MNKTDLFLPKSMSGFIKLTRPNINKKTEDLLRSLIILEIPYKTGVMPIGLDHQILELKTKEIVNELALRN